MCSLDGCGAADATLPKRLSGFVCDRVRLASGRARLALGRARLASARTLLAYGCAQLASEIARLVAVRSRFVTVRARFDVARPLFAWFRAKDEGVATRLVAFATQESMEAATSAFNLKISASCNS